MVKGIIENTHIISSKTTKFIWLLGYNNFSKMDMYFETEGVIDKMIFFTILKCSQSIFLVCVIFFFYIQDRREYLVYICNKIHWLFYEPKKSTFSYNKNRRKYNNKIPAKLLIKLPSESKHKASVKYSYTCLFSWSISFFLTSIPPSNVKNICSVEGVISLEILN